MTNTNDARRRSRLDVHQLMARAAAENAADLAEHGSYQRTAVDEAEAVHTAFRIGMWELRHDNHAEAKRWLTTAVDGGIDEARPLLQICAAALDPASESLDTASEEHDELLAEVHLAHSEEDRGPEGEAALPAALTGTPIYDCVVANEPCTDTDEGVADRLAAFRGTKTSSLFTPPLVPVLYGVRHGDLHDGNVLPTAGAWLLVIDTCTYEAQDLTQAFKGNNKISPMFRTAVRVVEGGCLASGRRAAGQRAPVRTRDRELLLTALMAGWSQADEHDEEHEDETPAQILRWQQGFLGGRHVRLPGSDLLVPASQSDYGRHTADDEGQPAEHDVRSSLVRNP